MTELCGPQIFICEDTSKYPITALACTSSRLNLWSICRGLSLFHSCIETICMENYQTITSFVFISLRFLTASLLFHFDGGARSWITSSVMVLTCFNSSCSGIFTFNGFHGPLQPELSERRAPCRHVTIMDLHSHILEIQLMPCHTFVLIKTRRFSFVKTLQNIQSLHSLARALGWTCGASVADSACFTYA